MKRARPMMRPDSPTSQGQALVGGQGVLDFLWLLLFGAVSAWWCLSAATELSAADVCIAANLMRPPISNESRQPELWRA